MSRCVPRAVLLLLLGSIFLANVPKASACTTSGSSCPHYANDMYTNNGSNGNTWGEWNHPIIFSGFFQNHSSYQARVDDAVAEINSEADSGNQLTMSTYDNAFITGYNWGSLINNGAACDHGHSGDLWEDPDATQHIIVAADNDGAGHMRIQTAASRIHAISIAMARSTTPSL